MHHYLVDLLVCPACHGDLAWTVSERDQSFAPTRPSQYNAAIVRSAP